MMPEKLIDEKLEKMRKVWKERYDPSQHEAIDKTIEFHRKFFREIPHDDGNQRVNFIGDTNTYLVPVEDIILYGLTYEQAKKYPTEQK